MSADYAGYLLKSGGKLIKQNQSRYFELRGTHLYYFKSKGASEAQGFIDLGNTKIVNNPKEQFSWTITGPQLPKAYTLIASSDAEKNVWMEKLTHLNTANTATLATKGRDSDDEGEEKMVYAAGEFSAGSKKISTSDFEVISVIGKGAFGKVMVVRKKDSKEVFAMKEMSKEIIERENLVEHTFAEKSILQRVRHPFIVTLHYAFQTADKLYLVMDFLAGGELFFHLGQVGRFDEWRAKFYCAQIGLAIGHIHAQNIIYRDLKPENIVLDKDGFACITDFGLAKTNVTGATAQTFCGTPEYLAPEFLIGGGHGKAVDWWSLGILLYEMLTGLPPFYSEHVTEMYELILKKPLEFDEYVPPKARDLCTKLLDRNPETRMQSVEAFKAHPFFADINFNDLLAKKLKVPFKPDPNALKNFGEEFTSMKSRLSTRDATGKYIAGFTYQGASSLPPGK